MEKFENADLLFIYLKTLALCFSVNEKYLGNRVFQKSMTSQYLGDFAVWLFFNHKSKMTGDCRVSKFFRRSADGKYLMRFLSETSIKLSSPFEKRRSRFTVNEWLLLAREKENPSNSQSEDQVVTSSLRKFSCATQCPWSKVWSFS